MANYPTTAFSPTTKNAGDTIAASHVNDLQAEVTAIETALLTSGLAHHLRFVDDTYDIGQPGATRPRHLYLSGNANVGLALLVGNNRVNSLGFYMTAWPTTASAANAFVADTDVVYRSTSSLRYKIDVVRLDAAHAKAVIASLKPITYRGVNDGEKRFAGFAAEEVADVDPLLVTRDKEGRPDYVTYDRIPAYLVPVVQDLERRLSALEAR